MNILFTSSGRRSYLIRYFKEALGENGTVHAGNSTFSSALYFADKTVITPPIYNIEYIPFLINYCKQFNINVIISLFDVDLPILSKHITTFKEIGVRVIVSNPDIINICNDKWQTFNFLKNNSISTPKTYLNILDVTKDLKERSLFYPLIIKPRWGMGSISVYSVNNDNELAVIYKMVEREIFESYLKFESEISPQHCVIIQEKLIGQEYGLDVINNLNNSYITTLVKKKIAMRCGETDSAITIDDNELVLLGQKISKVLGHIANLDVDCFRVENKLYVLDMNCRFGGHYPFSHIAGANIPLALIKWLKNEPVDNELFKIEYGVAGFKDYNVIKLLHE